jgi:CP family cyanate transporter-like MFS transporter
MFAGMLFTAAGAAGRGGASNVYFLYAATIVMGFGISIMQPALPALVREWTPQRMAFATAVSSNGMLVGVTLAPVLTIPAILPLLGQSWRLDLVFWAVPVAMSAAVFVLLRPAAGQHVQSKASGLQRWWPDWRSSLTWLLGLSFGSNNSIYYGTNGFLPDYLTSIGRQDLIGPALGWLNGAQLLASLVLLGTAGLIQHRTWPYPVVGGVTVLALLGILYTDGYWIVFCAATVGFATSMTFVMLLALPPALSPPHDVHRTAAGMFTISYSCAVVVPIVCGSLWDLTGIPGLAFVPLCIGAVTLGTFGAIVSLRDRRDY